MRFCRKSDRSSVTNVYVAVAPPKLIKIYIIIVEILERSVRLFYNLNGGLPARCVKMRGMTDQPTRQAGIIGVQGAI